MFGDVHKLFLVNSFADTCGSMARCHIHSQHYREMHVVTLVFVRSLARCRWAMAEAGLPEQRACL